MHFHLDMVQDGLERKRFLPQLTAGLDDTSFTLRAVENRDWHQQRHVVRVEAVVPAIPNEAIVPLRTNDGKRSPVMEE